MDKPPAQLTGQNKKQYVRGMFDSIAHRYDFLNHLLSGGIDWYWRKRTVDILQPQEYERVLDVATGTGDLAYSILSHSDAQVFGLDFAMRMLRLNKEKVSDEDDDRYNLIGGDAEKLPFGTGTFDIITIAYGIRNMGNMESALAELYRVLKPGGRVGVLEFSQPENRAFKQVYYFYFRNIMPAIGFVFSGNRDAYNYLQESVSKFPSRADFSRALEAVGFDSVHNYTMTMGISTLYIGFKK
ncbi:MAG: bifunctional demethylmenaquinone methyltransferase/2-methoxy-6-polyprenyl-1,4-benzoquinol methylase UbiE [Candidatus Marinimicrobia bacterium]|nr:bifunctional demethylmenaquinone methyltransferase/2-methoxy-6-polyprenyl-1,4-benzoquinol methylase UbiE [Candidatus Neomarinimicrobiota bacterium]MCF7827929.1 bifunctional demethylmenaquinone methyltransferase/2-methoxy-6-polyprenyl-1,4-benzoquinol methylase UbiE [Candidatus Neomarinimicrobiota bacterium]MCF7879316.1 bifunctional demethylmenaquinone methyltransferase/2-methoxy-6-polyprenyl-1,4-benzoquinol methylase UbiE [Candidatus Neomarinimicrobiota bacterium]